MAKRASFVALCCLPLHSFALSIPSIPRFVSASRLSHSQEPLRESLDSWIQREEQIALDKLLANIKPGGLNVEGKSGVADGTVIASPSQRHPDYWYQWVRDAAITTATLVDLYADDPSSELADSLTTVLDAYAKLQTRIQQTDNPSGSFDDLQGLGEPKFHVDGSAFTGSWGRPQRDGPALRAITLMNYVRAYNASHPSLWQIDTKNSFYKLMYEADMPARSVIKADLEYVSHFWNETGFDLWEEVDGMHFFTAMVQLRALREGTDIARAFGDPKAADWYEEQAGYLERFVRRFWNKNKGHLVETLWSRRSGLDCALLLGSLHAVPSDASGADPVFPPYSDEVLVSLLALVRDQRERFPINIQAITKGRGVSSPLEAAFEGVGVGRYPEDVYDGYGNSIGNPWFLCTSSAASVLYHTASHFSTSQSVAVNPLNYEFYTSLLPSSDIQINTTYTSKDAIFTDIINRLHGIGDEFLEVVKTHVDAEGSMSEQFDRETGFMRGANDLTWSYGAFLEAVKARKVASEVS